MKMVNTDAFLKNIIFELTRKLNKKLQHDLNQYFNYSQNLYLSAQVEKTKI